MSTNPESISKYLTDLSWNRLLHSQFEEPYFSQLSEFIASRAEKGAIIFPEAHLIFNALNLTSFDLTKVVLLGQDPYHGSGQAHGLCFSVQNGIPFPPSLKNIFKELKSDLNIEKPLSGNLENWARQGVLMLNATLTVEQADPGAHQGIGWEMFTDEIISILSREKVGLVFLLWGKFAQAKTVLIDDKKHFILKAAHPSPFSAYNGFFGCKHFSKTNELLELKGKSPVNWNPEYL